MSGVEERAFIHDLASPLSAGMLLVDMLVEKTQDSKDKELLTKVMAQLEKMNKLLNARREVLVKQGVPSSRPK